MIDAVWARPVDLSIIDGIETQTAGDGASLAEGSKRKIRLVNPGDGVADLPKAPKYRKRVSDAPGKSLVGALLANSTIPEPRIVGIDLTGSERRATGWALLHGAQAETKSLITDADLVRETLAAELWGR